jgi:hypothetical protein
MGEAKQRKLLAEKSGDNAGGRKSPLTIAQELRRRIDSGEPIKKTRDWFLKQEKSGRATSPTRNRSSSRSSST